MHPQMLPESHVVSVVLFATAEYLTRDLPFMLEHGTTVTISPVFVSVI